MGAFDLSEPQEGFNDARLQNARVLLQRSIDDAKILVEEFARARNEQLLVNQLVGRGMCREEAKALVKL